MSSSDTAATEFNAIERDVVDHVFALSPSYAVGLGLHEYDGRLPDLSSAATERWVEGADALLQRLASVPRESLPTGRKTDGFLLSLLLESPLFDIRMVSDLERNPMNYLGAVSLTSYLSRDYAPVDRRVGAIVRALEQVPRLLSVGRERLRAPLPKPFLDLSLAIGSGSGRPFCRGPGVRRPGAPRGLGPDRPHPRRGRGRRVPGLAPGAPCSRSGPRFRPRPGALPTTPVRTRRGRNPVRGDPTGGRGRPRSEPASFGRDREGGERHGAGDPRTTLPGSSLGGRSDPHRDRVRGGDATLRGSRGPCDRTGGSPMPGRGDARSGAARSRPRA